MKKREEKELLIRALEEKERRRREAPLLYYTPHEKQRLLHDAGRSYRRRCVFAGNRWGKTHAGAHEALAYVYGYRFWEVPELKLDPDTGDLPPRTKIPHKHWVTRVDGVPIRCPSQGMVITGLNTARGIGQVIWPALRDAIPPGLLASKAVHVTMGPNSVPIRITFPNGSTIFTGSKEQSRDQYEGFKLDWAWVDEPVPRWLYNGLWRALSDYYSSIWFTLTPLGPDSIWLMDWINDPKVWTVQGSQRENTFLPTKVFEEFENDGRFTKRERRARLFGEFEYLGDRVIENFEPDIHVIPSFKPPDHWIHGQTVDPHHRKAAAVTWWAVDPQNEPEFVYHFWREWPVENYHKLEGGGMSLPEYASLFRDVEGARAPDIRLCDPRFGKADWSSIVGNRGPAFQRTAWVDEMAEQGLHYIADIPGVSRLETGHMRITDLLRYNRNFPISPTNTPRIFVHDTCKNLIRSMLNYAYMEVKEPERGIVEKVSEEYKDFVDCVRYTVLYRIPIVTRGDEYGQFTDEDFARENQEAW